MLNKNRPVSAVEVPDISRESAQTPVKAVALLVAAVVTKAAPADQVRNAISAVR